MIRTLQKSLPTIAFVALALLFSFILVGGTRLVGASAPTGVPATQGSATTTVVGPQETKTLFASNSACASRIVRTQGTDIYIAFADPTNGDVASTTLSAVVGFTQPASTTVAYDSGLYGCGRMTAEAVASTTITTAQMF